MNNTDFLALSAKAMAPDGTIEDKNKLFTAFFELKEWIFITPKEMAMEPAIEIIDGKKWLMIFTDSAKAQTFAKNNPERYLGDSGEIFYLNIKVKDAVQMIMDLNSKGIFGLQINFGLPGWYVPAANIPNILSHLKITL